MDDAILLVSELGVPTAALIAVGFFLYKLIFKIIDGMTEKVDVLDDKVQASLDTMEERLTTKLDSQYGIIVSLIDRVRMIDQSLIRNDVLLKTLVKMPELIDTNEITKAQKDDQRKD
jgi:hypothetical protein|tara:strand:- start:3111 stop:3461 length:351 start_codon:yes stop_codon:yes gene_type:complete